VPFEFVGNVEVADNRPAGGHQAHANQAHLLRHLVPFALCSYLNMTYPKIEGKLKKPEAGKKSWWGRIFN
jgi:hypothetical protein